MASPDRLMETASHVLSALSQNVGIVISPSLAQNRLKHIEFLQFPDKRILVVLVSMSNIIHNKVIRIGDELAQDDLDKTANYLNGEFSGKSLVGYQNRNLEADAGRKSTVRSFVEKCHPAYVSGVSRATVAGEVYVDGASNILTKPDFVDFDRMQELFRTFEEKSRLIKILNECVTHDSQNYGGDVHVVIGREHPASSMQQLRIDYRSLQSWIEREHSALLVLSAR